MQSPSPHEPLLLPWGPSSQVWCSQRSKRLRLSPVALPGHSPSGRETTRTSRRVPFATRANPSAAKRARSLGVKSSKHTSPRSKIPHGGSGSRASGIINPSTEIPATSGQSPTEKRRTCISVESETSIVFPTSLTPDSRGGRTVIYTHYQMNGAEGDY